MSFSSFAKALALDPNQPSDPVAVEERIAYVCERHPELRDLPAKELDEGFAHLVIDFGDKFILRFPRDKEVPFELPLLDLLPQPFSIPVPVIAFRGDSPPYMGYPKLYGERLTPSMWSKLPYSHRALLAEGLATFFVELHGGVPWEAAMAIGVPAASPKDEAAWIEKLVLPSVEEHPLRELIERLLADHRALSSPSQLLTLHHDVHPYNFLMDPQTGALTGVFDFGDARIGDPHREFFKLRAFDHELFELTANAYEQQASIKLDRDLIAHYERIDHLKDLGEFLQHDQFDWAASAWSKARSWVNY